MVVWLVIRTRKPQNSVAPQKNLPHCGPEMQASQRLVMGQHAGRRIGDVLLHAVGGQRGQVPFAGFGAAAEEFDREHAGQRHADQAGAHPDDELVAGDVPFPAPPAGERFFVHLEDAADVREGDAVAADDAGNCADVGPIPQPWSRVKLLMGVFVRPPLPAMAARPRSRRSARNRPWEIGRGARKTLSTAVECRRRFRLDACSSCRRIDSRHALPSIFPNRPVADEDRTISTSSPAWRRRCPGTAESR